jgi:NAD(P)-dependent dehydrogenase (short-subunit alcohol dehydrogenase family)
MSGKLEGKRVVITGTAANIGKATALLFAREGASLVVADLDEQAQQTADEAAAQGTQATFVRTDVTSSDDMKRLMDKAAETMGGVDVIVNNAGLQRSGSVTDFAEDDWDALMRVNPRSCFLGAKFGVPHLRRSGGGAIVNTASLAGVKGGPGMTAYSASKGAIIAFTKALAAELAPDRIRVNTICPGWIDTPFNQPAIDFMGGRDEQAKVIEAVVPMSRQGVPEEVANGMVFLASEMSSYMTGQALIIDGGVY